MQMHQVMVMAVTAARRGWLAELARHAMPCHVLQAQGPREALAGPPLPCSLLLLGLDAAAAQLPSRCLLDLRRRWSAAPLVLIADRLHVPVLDQLLAAGHGSYLLATQPPDELRLLLARAAAGEPVHAPPVWQLLLQRLRAWPPPPTGLTPRERDVLLAVGSGLTNAQAARQLGLRPATVASYVKQVYRKLGIRNRAQAAQMAGRLGRHPPAPP